MLVRHMLLPLRAWPILLEARQELFLYGLCGGFCLEYTRGRIVAAKGIKEGLCEYGLKLLCCGACMDCQLFAEIEGSG